MQTVTRFVVAQIFEERNNSQWRVWDDERKKFISYHDTQADAANVCAALSIKHQQEMECLRQRS